MAAFAVYRQLSGRPIDPAQIVLILLPSAVTLLVVACARVEVLYNSQGMHYALLAREMSLFRGLIVAAAHRVDEAEPPRVEILETPFDFYRGLNDARDESTKSISVMKLHHKGPRGAGVRIGKELSPRFAADRTLLEK